MTWQDIETAPKDGRPILACDASDGEMAVVAWDGEDWLIATSVGREYSDRIYMDFPSHWVALPDPPSPSRASAVHG